MVFLPELLPDMLSTLRIYLMTVCQCLHVIVLVQNVVLKYAACTTTGRVMPKTNTILVGNYLICDSAGTSTRFEIHPACPHNTTVVDDLACTLPCGAILLSDCGYVSEPLRHQLEAR
jgi:hypothetical protein